MTTTQAPNLASFVESTRAITDPVARLQALANVRRILSIVDADLRELDRTTIAEARAAGLTTAQIAALLGVTRQRVEQRSR